MFEIPLMSWIVASGLIFGVFWSYYFLMFLFNRKKEVKVSKYFQVMFKSFKSSELRIGWSSTIFALMYITGLLVTGFIKSTWYPAQWLRGLLGYIFFSNKRLERIKLEKLKDKKGK